MRLWFWFSFALVFAAASAHAETAAVPHGKLVEIPAGKLSPFWIRPKRLDAPARPLEVAAFLTQSRPVTNGEFKAFLAANPEWQKDKVARIFADPAYLSQLKSKEKAPVTFVSWFAARAYCSWLGMRLPTLYEWEYMAAASAKTRDATADPEFLREILEWYSRPQAEGGLAEVGQAPKNFYGVQDLHNLIWEWVEDFNSNLVTGESRSDGSLDRNLFCGAGGMNAADKQNYAAFMRFAFRSSLKGSFTIWNLGFRCVKEKK